MNAIIAQPETLHKGKRVTKGNRIRSITQGKGITTLKQSKHSEQLQQLLNNKARGRLQ